MSVNCENYTGNEGGFGKFLLLVVLILLATLGFLISHAKEKHPYDAESVRNCFSRNGTLQIWSGENKKWGRICQMDDGLFGIQILADKGGGHFEEITTFLKEKFKSIGQVEKYMKNGGYELQYSGETTVVEEVLEILSLP